MPIDTEDPLTRKVLDFVKKNTKIFDESHDWRHAVAVAEHATQIRDTKEVLYLALLHDVCDHKYADALPRAELSAWIAENLPGYPRIDGFIDQISFSKQRKSGDMSRQDPVLEAVRDADRLEAIGEVGLQRCMTYTKASGGRVPEDVIQHCHDKLLRLLPEGYIVTEKGRELAAPRHQVIVDYVKSMK